MSRDETYFLDMLLAAHNIQEFTENMTKEEFLASKLHQSAVVREAQVIGEAARLVSDEAKAEHTEIEWKKISGMRNYIIHEYFRVDLSIIWAVVENEIDTLINQLEPLVPPPNEESENNE